MEKNSKHPNKSITDEERLELCKKLDKELDEFIERLPRKKYEDGWPEHRWEEEMEKHPFFMTKPPEAGDELNPLYEGLQALKYDPEYNEPEELAMSYKDDGNFNFKHKNYRLAIVAYTEGIKMKCGNSELEANLYNNRAAAHYFLKNYRSSLKDCEWALKVKPEYDKALRRAANCCYQIKQFQKCMRYCDSILEKRKDDQEILGLISECVKSEQMEARNERKRDAESRKKEKKEENLLNEIRKRGYKIEGNISLANLEPCFPQLIHNRVYIDESSNLVWPVVFIYPEYKIMDYIQKVSEKQTLYEQFLQVFEKYPEWDKERKYKVDQLNVYYETSKKKINNVAVDIPICDILKSEGYIITGGTPSFIILVRGTPAESRFFVEYK